LRSAVKKVLSENVNQVGTGPMLCALLRAPEKRRELQGGVASERSQPDLGMSFYKLRWNR